MSDALPLPDRCNCPPITPRTMREGVGTKPPCPVHETPEMLAALAEVIVPAKPMGEFKIAPFRDEGATYDPRHPHEPEIPPCIADDGHCRVCRLVVERDGLQRQLEERGAENGRLRTALREIKDEMNQEDGSRAIAYALSSGALDEQHVHTWKTTGSADTGHQPPRLEYECSICDERVWTNDPSGPSRDSQETT